jgi:hypothetical protein
MRIKLSSDNEALSMAKGLFLASFGCQLTLSHALKMRVDLSFSR